MSHHLDAKDLHWFRLANSAPPAGFYLFKDRFLKRFGERAGYDLQKIERCCWSCEGSGTWNGRDRCDRCAGSGIYRIDDVWLQRWLLGGAVYHKPVDNGVVWHENHYRYPEPFNVIEGRIRHGEVSAAAARRAFYRLLLRHEPMNFYNQVVREIKGKVSAHRMQLHFCLIRLRNKLDLFKTIPEDDVPF